MQRTRIDVYAPINPPELADDDDGDLDEIEIKEEPIDAQFDDLDVIINTPELDQERGGYYIYK